jgi:tetratricopeptide (TPR) repeat protein
MLPPFEYKKARIQACFHVQVEFDTVPPDVRTPGDVRVNARVIRIFRGSSSLRVGDRVEFAVSSRRKQDGYPAPGGVLWTDYARLVGARYMEVYLNGKPPDCPVALWQSEILETACDTPVLPCTPADSLDELVGVLAGGRFLGRPVRARFSNDPSEASALRIDSAVRTIGGTPTDLQNTSEDQVSGNCNFRLGDGILTVYRDANAIDIEGPPAGVLRLMYAVCGLPITEYTGAIQRRTGKPETEAIVESVDHVQTSLSYANKLAEAGENDGALFMLDLSIPGLERLALQERHLDQLKTLATALVTRGTVLDRLDQDATAQALFQRANELMAEADRGRNAAYRWAVEYLDRAKKEDRAGRHRSAAGLFGQVITSLEQLVNRDGRVDLGAQLAKALVGRANALTQLGEAKAALPLCGRAIAILEPMVHIDKRLALEPDLLTAKYLKSLAESGSPS